MEEIRNAEKGVRDDCLVIIYAPTALLYGKRFLLNKEVITLGRDISNDIVLDRDSVSRQHCKIERRGERLLITDLDSTNGTYVNDETDPINCIQLRRGDEIKIGDTIFRYLTGSDVESQYHETIYKMTITDGLTGVSNKRYLTETLERELPRAQRHDRKLSLLMIDIDHFKNVNDTYGHLAGDSVLKELAADLREKLRPEDTFARYGGEEFVVVLPETPLEGAIDTAERLREVAQNHTHIFEGNEIIVTISIGVSEFQKGWSVDKLIQSADNMLYEAKLDGRNRTRPKKAQESLPKEPT